MHIYALTILKTKTESLILKVWKTRRHTKWMEEGGILVVMWVTAAQVLKKCGKKGEMLINFRGHMLTFWITSKRTQIYYRKVEGKNHPKDTTTLRLKKKANAPNKTASKISETKMDRITGQN